MLLFIIAIASLCGLALGGLFAIKMSDRLHLILGFSAGSVMGVALFGLLPEAVETGGSHVFLLVAAGFVAYMILDRSFALHSHRDEDCHNPRHDGRFGAVALILHCLLDGVAIGVSLRISNAIGLSVAVAIIAHQFSDGINVVNMLVRDGNGGQRPILWLLWMWGAVAVGLQLGNSVLFGLVPFGVVIPLFVGTFLYLGASDLLPESHHAHPTIWTTVLTVLGMAFIYGVTTLHSF